MLQTVEMDVKPPVCLLMVLNVTFACSGFRCWCYLLFHVCVQVSYLAFFWLESVCALLTNGH